MATREQFEQLRRWLEPAERILLLAHRQPDGDGIASALAVQHLLRSFGKTAICVSLDPLPPAFRFLPAADGFQTDFFIGDYDLIMTFDCGDLRRTGFADRLTSFARTKQRLVNVDHHPKNDLHRLANLNLIDFDAAATAQVVYQLFHALRWPMDHHIATCLLCGLHTDTGGFKHPNTTPTVLEIAADLLAHGGRLREISRQMQSARSVAMLRLWGIALNRLQCREDFGIVCSLVTLEDLDHCHATTTDIAGVVNLIKNIPNTKVAMLFAEQMDGSIKVSLRTDAHHVDVSRLAALFGGGGLKKAGGFSIPGRILQTGDQWHITWH